MGLVKARTKALSERSNDREAKERNGVRRLFWRLVRSMSRWSEPGHIFRQCALCGKTFRIFKSQLIRPRRRGLFCTNKCHAFALKLFSEGLATGRLGPILKELIAEVLKKAA